MREEHEHHHHYDENGVCSCGHHHDEDLALLAKGMKLLQMDYLGGHGSRGSGRVSLKNFALKSYGAPADLDELKALFDEVDSYELFPV